MRKVITFLLTLTICFSLFFVFFLKPKSYVLINGIQFTVDVAKTNDQKARGLNIYNKLPLTKGMVFPFEQENYYAFWMKDMKFPIDIIYIQNDKVVDIFPSVPNPKNTKDNPVMVKPRSKANLVLEINAGLVRKYNFKIGDKVETHL